MKKQPIINIGTLGSVSDGKSTNVNKLTGTVPQRHSKEKVRNITIKPGYANMKIWQLSDGSYKTTSSKETIEDANLVHHLSFVDCPGHQELILTMMGSVSLMKGAIIVVSAAEPIEKKPQLIQHLAAAKLAGLDKLVILFNKLDLITKDIAIERKNELDELLQKLDIKPQYIIPTALNREIGIQNELKAIMELFPPSSCMENNTNTEFKLTRSFDINKPGLELEDLVGGVIGGSLISGKLKVGDEIEIRPGSYIKDKSGEFIVIPHKTRILSIESDNIVIDELNPGGLAAIKTDLDPFYCKNDKLAGQVVGLIGQLPNIYSEIIMNINLTNQFNGHWTPQKNDKIYLQIGNVNTEAILKDFDDVNYSFELSKPSCISDNALIMVCSDLGNDTLKIVGYGNFKAEYSKQIYVD